MFMQMRFDQASAVTTEDELMRTQAHAMGCATDLGHDPYARLWEERRRKAQRGLTCDRVCQVGSPTA